MSHYAEPIVRMYDTVFHRAPDMAGQSFWDNALHQGFTLHDIAGQFVTAPEFAVTYGQPDSASFVQSMYHNVLGRGGEAEGASFWAYNLDHGLTDRAEIVVAFSESAEHIAHLAAPAAAPAPVSQNPASPDAGFVPMHPSGPAPTTGPTVAHHEGPHNDPAPTPAASQHLDGTPGNDTLIGGTGDDFLVGGRGSDVLTGGGGNDLFVFYPGDGHDRITDYHRGDHILIFDAGADHTSIIAAHGPPANPGEMSSFAGYDVMYGTGASQGSIHLDGITYADLPWVQDSFQYGIG